MKKYTNRLHERTGTGAQGIKTKGRAAMIKKALRSDGLKSSGNRVAKKIVTDGSIKYAEKC